MDFQRLMTDLISEEETAIPELPRVVTELGLSPHPAFANLFSKNEHPRTIAEVTEATG
jgi:hypothetical protein